MGVFIKNIILESINVIFLSHKDWHPTRNIR